MKLTDTGVTTLGPARGDSAKAKTTIAPVMKHRCTRGVMTNGSKKPTTVIATKTTTVDPKISTTARVMIECVTTPTTEMKTGTVTNVVLLQCRSK